MSIATPNIKKRSDYQAPHFSIDTVDLQFELQQEYTLVSCTTSLTRVAQSEQSLVLDGIDLTLLTVEVDGVVHSNYDCDDMHLTIHQLPPKCELRIKTKINPAKNTSLEGLYQASGAYCTQCEAEGFRKITYFMDRPDVLAEYRVKITADKNQYPYLLSNGNKVAEGVLDDGRHFVEWHDPFKKPCYLFALVAGDFDLLEDDFVTQSGKPVKLELFVDKGKLNRGQHALTSLKKAMAWDEQVFGLEHDLDIYMIVAVDFFNMGAMENKGLNVFNSKFVLADSKSATDEDYFNIEAVIGHEYFHNWTGNRVTCRDWFQLSLKEGLTVFRDQQFSADMSSAVVNRIKNVKIMREHQFAEDASAMAHPIRPDAVMEMNNFYTVTVYDKGSEVIRMQHTLLGEQGFRKGMDLYFERFDGQAVTCDDFVQAMEDANQYDLSVFRNWYSQSGTPRVVVEDLYNVDEQSYELSFKQINQPTADQLEKTNLHIPIRYQLLNQYGQPITLANGKLTDIVDLKATEHRLSFRGIKQKPVPVLLGDFSAPVKLDYAYSNQQLTFISLNSTDQFCRWDAAQKLLSQYIHHQAKIGFAKNQILNESIQGMISALLLEAKNEPALISEMITLPSYETLTQQVESFDVVSLFQSRKNLIESISRFAERQLLELFEQSVCADYQYDSEQVDKRRIKNVCLGYLAHHSSAAKLIRQQYASSDNMTDTLGALKAAQEASLPLFDELMADFESIWSNDPLVLDKWFSLHASTHRDDILTRLELLANHSQFNINNPNRVRSLIGTFAFYNPMGFHAIDGSGYRFVTDYLLKLDKINPQICARLVTPLTQWQRLDLTRQNLIRLQLARLLDNTSLSKDVFEKVSKSLNFEPD
jgi:aminopeptidase N